MNILFLGDVFASSGRRIVSEYLAEIVSSENIDLTVANAENAAGGFGITPLVAEELFSFGIDALTTGNHIWDKREGIPLLDSKDNIVRPGNYPGSPGRGAAVVPGTGGRVAVVNLQGRVFMPPLDCPFRTADRLLAELPAEARIIVVDFHGEATSEKIAMGYYLDGRVSMVLGTHTHVPTRDARLMPRGTAYVTDVGMTGSNDSILGVRKEDVIERFLTMRPTRFEVAHGDVRCDYVVADIDEATGRARSFEHAQIAVEA